MAETVDFLARYGWYIGIPLLFITIVLYVMRPSARRRYHESATIPFLNKRKDNT